MTTIILRGDCRPIFVPSTIAVAYGPWWWAEWCCWIDEQGRDQ